MKDISVQQRKLIERNSIFARIIAQENLTVVYNNMHTASFNPKDRVLTLPILTAFSEAEYMLFSVHEVGHAHFTPTDYSSIVKRERIDPRITNIVEDARIEKLMKRRFAGVKRIFGAGYREFLDNDRFGIANKKLDTLHFIDRINIHFKAGASLVVPFSDEENAIVKEIDGLETFDEVVDMVKRLMEYMPSSVMQGPSDIVDSGNGEGDNADVIPADGQESESASASDDERAGGESEGESDNDGDEKEGDAGLESDDEGDDNSPGFTLDNEKKQMKPDGNADFVDLISINKGTSWLDRFDTKRYYDKNNLMSLTSQLSGGSSLDREELLMVSALVNEFERRKAATDFQNTLVAKTGVVDGSRVYRYKFSDDIFRKKDIILEGKSHGVLIAFDMSASMYGSIGEVMRQAVILAEFCRRVNIPFEVYGFHDSADYLFMDHNMGRQHYENAKLFMLSPIPHRLGMTPLNKSILHMRHLAIDRKLRWGVDKIKTIYLTDGASCKYAGIGRYTSVCSDLTRRVYRPEYSYDDASIFAPGVHTTDFMAEIFTKDTGQDITLLLYNIEKEYKIYKNSGKSGFSKKIAIPRRKKDKKKNLEYADTNAEVAKRFSDNMGSSRTRMFFVRALIDDLA